MEDLNLTDLNTYQNWVWDTTSPLTKEMESPGMLAWALLGLGAEVGETQELVEKSLRKGTLLDVDKLEDELGDVLWYLTAVANAVDLSLDDIMHNNISKINSRIEDAKSITEEGEDRESRSDSEEG